MPDAPIPLEKVFQVVVQIAVLLLAVSVHESAHGLAALRFGDTTARDLGRITLNPIKHMDLVGSLLLPLVLALTGAPIFGWAKPVPISLRGVRHPRRAALVISAAGPLSNLALAAVSGVLFVFFSSALRDADAGSLLVPLRFVAFVSVLVNVALGIFNLVPIPPLDGFGVVESLLPPRFLPAVIWLRRYGFVVLVVIMLTGALGLVLDPPLRLVVRLLHGGFS